MTTAQTAIPFLEQVLYDNAIDFINKSMESYLDARDNQDPKEYKYAVLFLATGTELILKSILHNKHPLFVLSNIDSLDDKTVAAEKLIGRINRVYEDERKRIHNLDAENFQSIREIRNSIMHKDVRFDVAPDVLYAKTLYSLDRIAKQFLGKTLHEQVDLWTFVINNDVVKGEYYKQMEGYKINNVLLPCGVCSLEKLKIDSNNPNGLICFHCNQKYNTVPEAIKAIEDIDKKEDLFIEYVYLLSSNGYKIDTCPQCGVPDYLHYNSDIDQLICFECGVINSDTCPTCHTQSAFAMTDDFEKYRTYCLVCETNPHHNCDLCINNEYDYAGNFKIDIRNLKKFKDEFGDISLSGVFPVIDVCENCLPSLKKLERKEIIDFI